MWLKQERNSIRCSLVAAVANASSDIGISTLRRRNRQLRLDSPFRSEKKKEKTQDPNGETKISEIVALAANRKQKMHSIEVRFAKLEESDGCSGGIGDLSDGRFEQSHPRDRKEEERQHFSGAALCSRPRRLQWAAALGEMVPG
ncbi:hypothetical protein KM043_009040 [Ampulex compressa]|nr:hypothetical protein KM043_009040 [Ampulex compressa]